MSETLSQKQRRFAKLVARLIDKAHELGFEITLGDAYRDPRVFGQVGVSQGYGNARSGHKQRLAIDLNLWRDGAWLTTTEAHKLLGQWWKLQGDGCSWGGDFKTPDGNHYSIEHNGVK